MFHKLRTPAQSDDPGSLRGLIHLVDRRGRCGKKTCALLLPSLDAQFASRTTLAALGAAVPRAANSVEVCASTWP